MTVSLGLAGALGADVIAVLAPQIEAVGFDTLWVNDTPDGDALAALAAAAAVTDRLRLATGVVALDRRPAADILAASRDLPQERLTLGIGSGVRPAAALDRVRAGLATLETLPDARIVVGALGPRMRLLAVTESDGVLLNWLTPDTAAAQAEDLHAAASGAHVALYVRTALDPAAFARLRKESARYASFPNYAANFARLGIDVADTVIEGEDALGLRIPQYTAAVDEVVLRAITPDDTVAAYRAFFDAAADAPHGPVRRG